MCVCLAFAALYGKAFLQISEAPMLLTAGQALVGTIATFLYVSNLGRDQVPMITGSVTGIAVVLLSHFIGTALTNVSTFHSSASFVNTLKAADPFFAVFFSWYIMNQKFTPVT